MGPADSILRLTTEIVRLPSRGGVDPYRPVVDAVVDWLSRRDLAPEVIRDRHGEPQGVRAMVTGGGPGPLWVLNATLDTAGLGDESRWTMDPFGATVRDGWLYGRGSADSKVGVAVFCHVLAALAADRHQLRGSVAAVFDADEHTGGFAGARLAFADATGDPAGVFIGYPGCEKISAGSRGFARAEISVRGQAAHSGSSRHVGVNAVTRAARLVEALSRAELPGDSTPGFPLPPKLTVTAIHGGDGYSQVPDLCRINVDVRLTPAFDANQARALVQHLCEPHDAKLRWLEGWPAYRVGDGQPMVSILRGEAERVLGRTVPIAVVGPSNIGNYLATRHIPAICGFGVNYRGAHAEDECIEVATVGPVFEVYLCTLTRLLGGSSI